MLAISDAQASSGQHSLYSEIGDPADADSYRAQLYKDGLDAGFPLVLEFDLMIAMTQPTSAAGGSCFIAAFVDLAASLTGGNEALAVGRSGNTDFNILIWPNNPSTLLLPEMQWHHVLYRIDGQGFTAVITPKTAGAVTTTRKKSMTIDASPPQIDLGVRIGSGGGPVRAYFDNVVLHQ